MSKLVTSVSIRVSPRTRLTPSPSLGRGGGGNRPHGVLDTAPQLLKAPVLQPVGRNTPRQTRSLGKSVARQIARIHQTLHQVQARLRLADALERTGCAGLKVGEYHHAQRARACRRQGTQQSDRDEVGERAAPYFGFVRLPLDSVGHRRTCSLFQIQRSRQGLQLVRAVRHEDQFVCQVAEAPPEQPRRQRRLSPPGLARQQKAAPLPADRRGVEQQPVPRLVGQTKTDLPQEPLCQFAHSHALQARATVVGQQENAGDDAVNQPKPEIWAAPAIS